jgi:protein-arginine kinase activator protein McsA
MKVCNKCQTLKAKVDFYKDTAKKDQLRTICKSCTNTSQKNFRIANPDKIKARRTKYKQNHPDKIVESDRKYYKKTH